jgi:hypothetical protein
MLVLGFSLLWLRRVLHDATPCSLAQVYRSFGDVYCLRLKGYKTLKTEATRSSDPPLNTYKTTRRFVPENTNNLQWECFAVTGFLDVCEKLLYCPIVLAHFLQNLMKFLLRLSALLCLHVHHVRPISNKSLTLCITWRAEPRVTAGHGGAVAR